MIKLYCIILLIPIVRWDHITSICTILKTANVVDHMYYYCHMKTQTDAMNHIKRQQQFCAFCYFQNTLNNTQKYIIVTLRLKYILRNQMRIVHRFLINRASHVHFFHLFILWKLPTFHEDWIKSEFRRLKFHSTEENLFNGDCVCTYNMEINIIYRLDLLFPVFTWVSCIREI